MQYRTGLAAIVSQAAPAIAPSAASAGSGSVNAGTHRWGYTWVNAAGGETQLSPLSGQVNLGSPSQVTVSGIKAGPAGTTKRRIYRTVAGDTGDPLLVGEVNDNVDDQTFLDDVPDANLGAPAPAASTFPTAMVELSGGGVTNDAQAPIEAGDEFKFLEETLAFYTVASIVDTTHFMLTAPYSGALPLDTGHAYIVVRDYTPNRGLAELSPGDRAIRDVITQNMRRIDTFGDLFAIDGGSPSALKATIRLRGGTAAQWSSANPILAAREVGLETDTRKIKIGDGVTAWNSLPYIEGGGGGGGGGAPVDAEFVVAVANGVLTAERVLQSTTTVQVDLGTAGQVKFNVPDQAITVAKLQHIATASLLGRVTAGTGVVEVLTAAQATALLNVFTDVLKGLVPPSGGGTTKFLRADGVWEVPPGAGGGGSLNLKALTPPALNGDVHNYAPTDGATKHYWRQAVNVRSKITGIAGGADDAWRVVLNLGPAILDLAEEDAGSTAANRIWTGIGGQLSLGVGDMATLIYDSVDTRWRVANVH